MNTRSPLGAVLVAVLISAMAFPPVGAAQAQMGQPAGKIVRVIPSVNIARGTEQLTAEVKTPVDWGDVIKTEPDGRARVGLEDGSVLNVGADTTVGISQPTAAQQTQLDLTYGRVRATVAKFTRANASFEVHTPLGVASVVGADVHFFNENDVFGVIDFEGTVHFCTTAGACVDLVAGQFASIRGDHAPDAASQATPDQLSEAVAGTTVDLVAPADPPPPTHHFTTGQVFGLTMLVVIPLVIVSITLRGKPAIGANGCDVGVPAC